MTDVRKPADTAHLDPVPAGEGGAGTTPPSRFWYWAGMAVLGLAVAALALRTFLPGRSAPAASFGGGCDHTLDADGVSACPHGVNAEGGCNMNAAEVLDPAAGPSGGPLRWVLPAGWIAERAGGGMRVATLRPADPGNASVSVVALPGRAGGELANVNRWRGQIGLPPVGDRELPSLRRFVTARAGQVSVFDLDNPGQPEGRMVVGVLKSSRDTWFVKLTGDRASVAKARSAFLKLLESLQPGEAVS